MPIENGKINELHKIKREEQAKIDELEKKKGLGEITEDEFNSQVKDSKAVVERVSTQIKDLTQQEINKEKEDKSEIYQFQISKLSTYKKLSKEDKLKLVNEFVVFVEKESGCDVKTLKKIFGYCYRDCNDREKHI